MSENDPRPPVWVGHVVLETPQLRESAAFMRLVGMRSVHEGDKVAIFELRGGTHLVLIAKEAVTSGDASFDLMVDDLQETHRRFAALGLAPTAIEARPSVSHELFKIREPGGRIITFFSSHVSGPV